MRLDLARAARRRSGGARDRGRVGRADAAGAGSPRSCRSSPPRSLPRVAAPAARPQRAGGDRRRARGLARRRAGDRTRSSPSGSAVVIGTGIGGADHPARPVRHPARTRRAHGSSPLHGADAHAERAGRRSRPGAQGAGRRARAGARPARPASEAVACGLDMIRAGRADVVVGRRRGGRHPPAADRRRSRRCGRMSTRNDDPEPRRGRSTSARDGFVLGEGAGILVLEARASTPRPAARRCYAVLAGAGMTARRPPHRGPGARRRRAGRAHDGGAARRRAVARATSATSTPTPPRPRVGDVAEAVAMRGRFGARTDAIAVTATKSCTGHLLGAAGARRGRRHGAGATRRSSRRPQPRRPRRRGRPRHRPGEPADLPVGRRRVVNNSFGFGGHNVALAFTRGLTMNPSPRDEPQMTGPAARTPTWRRPQRPRWLRATPEPLARDPRDPLRACGMLDADQPER